MRIKLFAMDVDGTLTDGKIYVGANGEIMKAFNIKDGCGIREILPSYGVCTVIITGKNTKIVQNRANELQVQYIYQGVQNKGAVIRELSEKLHLKKSEMAYIGDDVNDIPAMDLCGVIGCPGDAVETVKKRCHFVSEKDGGEGAVREFIEWLVCNGYVVRDNRRA